MKILIVKMSALGDVVMTLPALRALKLRYPEAAIDWLVEEASSGLLMGLPDINKVLVSPRRALSGLVKSGKFIQAARLFLGFLRELRSVEYDAAIDLQGLFKSALWLRLARSKRRIGFLGSREKTALFLNEKMPAYDPERHAALRYLDAAVYLGAALPEPLPARYYSPPPEAAREAEIMLGDAKDFIILNPGAKWESKRWPLPHWQKLAALLAAQGRSLVLTGGAEDRDVCAGIEKIVPQSKNLCGLTPLPVLAAVMEKSALIITADTGPMHLAAAVGARGLALFGPTKPGRTGPFGGRFTILQPEKSCLGCLKRACEKSCLEDLLPETVLAACSRNPLPAA